MKKNWFWLFSLVLTASALTFTACETDPCKDVDCGANGTCFDGACVCDVGYEQDAEGKCTVETRTKFTGNWRVNEECVDVIDNTKYPASFNIIMNGKVGDIERITITGFGNSGTSTINAKVNNNAVTIDANQKITEVSSGVEFLVLDGAGTLTGNTLNFTYKLGNPANAKVEFNCTASAVKL
jgi:hypothetical protein